MRVAVLGTGLLGGSIGLGCIRCGHEVVGFDYDPPRAERAQELGAITCSAASIREAVADVDLAFVAVPVGSIAEVAAQALDAGAPVVTDVGSVKQPVVEAVLATAGEGAARFVGGHP
ncbi:MAG TPA: prephenate dehydrogenase/arogenate dehydrogenase family protein, partial [Acidimicrobiia bacterium]|nr:prephenate dehydrogenase/arogenate dehydrogenase family protein [Acidimicrobiia bacterium]